eukprot:tig00021537_g22295.t1
MCRGTALARTSSHRPPPPPPPPPAACATGPRLAALLQRQRRRHSESAPPGHAPGSAAGLPGPPAAGTRRRARGYLAPRASPLPAPPAAAAAGPAPPPEFVDPLSGALFRDPVVCSDGMSYERATIEAWLLYSDRSPATGARLPSRVLYPNLALKAALSRWAAAAAVSASAAEPAAGGAAALRPRSLSEAGPGFRPLRVDRGAAQAAAEAAASRAACGPAAAPARARYGSIEEAVALGALSLGPAAPPLAEAEEEEEEDGPHVAAIEREAGRAAAPASPHPPLHPALGLPEE